jgi:hypothetical protein
LKIAREIVKVLDGRLVAIAGATVVLGFVAAHLNGLRVAADLSGVLLSGSVGYKIGFSQAVLTTQVIVLAVALVAGAATIINIGDYKRLAVQLILTSAIFATINFAVLSFWPADA